MYGFSLKKKLQARKKKRKFIGGIISRNSENLDRHNAAVSAKFIHLHSKKNYAGYLIKLLGKIVAINFGVLFL